MFNKNTVLLSLNTHYKLTHFEQDQLLMSYGISFSISSFLTKKVHKICSTNITLDLVCTSLFTATTTDMQKEEGKKPKHLAA